MSTRKSIKGIDSLPVYNYKNDIVEKLKQCNILIIIGETGCGKTTQIPKILYQNNKKKLNICVTQPRRVAAISVANRVAKEIGEEIGNLVGYSVRFDDKYSNLTKIKYVTDGILLREAMIDNKLSKSINSDILLAIAKNIISQRNDFKLVIMSATLDTDKISSYFNNAANIIKIEGRNFPIEIYNCIEEESNYIDSTFITILQIHLSKEEEEFENGDILVFLPGQEDIEDLQELLVNKLELLIKCNQKRYEIRTIFSALPNYEQMKIFLPTQKGTRKIILSTNIAETSITIPNIRYVLDCGYSKIRKYHAKTNFDTLKISKISKNSAIQRAGRAGREAKGKCFRIYTEKFFFEMQEFNQPEILRINLRNSILNLKAMGYGSLHEFDFLDKPPHENLIKAYEELIALGAIDSDAKLTEEGRSMSTLPLEPIYSKIILKSLEDEFYDIRDEIVTIISILQSDNIFYTPSTSKDLAEKMRKKFTNPISDHITLLNVYYQWKESKKKNEWSKEHFINSKSLEKAENIKDQLVQYLIQIENLKKTKNEQIDQKSISLMNFKYQSIQENKFVSSNQETDKKYDLIIKCLLSGYFMNVAQYHSDNIFISKSSKISCKIHPTSSLINNIKAFKDYEYIIFNEMIEGSKMFIKYCSLVKPEFIFSIQQNKKLHKI